MANLDSPHGFWPAVGTGGSTTPRIREYAVRNGGASIGQGDIVTLTATGASLLIAANASYILGVAAHQWTSASSIRTLKVFDDPNCLFVAQHDGTPSSAHNIGAYYSVTIAARNGTTLMSKFEIDTSASNLTPTLHPLQMVAFSREEGRNVVGANVEAVVRFTPGFHVWGKNSGLGI